MKRRAFMTGAGALAAFLFVATGLKLDYQAIQGMDAALIGKAGEMTCAGAPLKVTFIVDDKARRRFEEAVRLLTAMIVSQKARLRRIHGFLEARFSRG